MHPETARRLAAVLRVFRDKAGDRGQLQLDRRTALELLGLLEQNLAASAPPESVEAFKRGVARAREAATAGGYLTRIQAAVVELPADHAAALRASPEWVAALAEYRQRILEPGRAKDPSAVLTVRWPMAHHQLFGEAARRRRLSANEAAVVDLVDALIDTAWRPESWRATSSRADKSTSTSTTRPASSAG